MRLCFWDFVWHGMSVSGVDRILYLHLAQITSIISYSNLPTTPSIPRSPLPTPLSLSLDAKRHAVLLSEVLLLWVPPFCPDFSGLRSQAWSVFPHEQPQPCKLLTKIDHLQSDTTWYVCMHTRSKVTVKCLEDPVTMFAERTLKMFSCTLANPPIFYCPFPVSFRCENSPVFLPIYDFF